MSVDFDSSNHFEIFLFDFVCFTRFRFFYTVNQTNKKMCLGDDLLTTRNGSTYYFAHYPYKYGEQNSGRGTLALSISRLRQFRSIFKFS